MEKQKPNLNLRDMLKDLEESDAEVPGIINVQGLNQMMETLIPGGIDSLQKMMDDMAPLMEQRKKINERATELAEQVRENHLIDGNSTVNDMSAALGDMFKSLGEDEQFTEMMAGYQDQSKKIGEEIKKNLEKVD